MLLQQIKKLIKSLVIAKYSDILQLFPIHFPKYPLRCLCKVTRNRVPIKFVVSTLFLITIAVEHLNTIQVLIKIVQSDQLVPH